MKKQQWRGCVCQGDTARVTKVDGLPLPIDDDTRLKSGESRTKFHNSAITSFAYWSSKGLPKIKMRTEISFCVVNTQEKIITR